MRDIQMIQWARVRELRDEVGADDFGDLVDLFLTEVEEVVDRLRSQEDRTDLEQDLHFLKGSALSLGFETFSDLCESGETLSAHGKAAQVDLGAILDGYDQSRLRFLADMSRELGSG
jgi:HPt (histidine-containing phosphotransfer) domain-containing protein